MRQCPTCFRNSIPLGAFMASGRWRPIQCPECGATSQMDKRGLWRPYLFFAAGSIVYFVGLVWAMSNVDRLPTWLKEHAEIVVGIWLLPTVAFGIWLTWQLYHLPLRAIDGRTAPDK